MGAWGTGPFDNDDAGEWLDRLTSQKSLRSVRAAFDRVLSTESPEADDCSHAIAAAEAVAAIAGKPGKNLPVELKEWIERVAVEADAKLIEQALSAIRQIRENSELRALWDDEQGWLKSIDGLTRRLKLVSRTTGDPHVDQQEPVQRKPPRVASKEVVARKKSPPTETEPAKTAKPRGKPAISLEEAIRKLKRVCNVRLSDQGELVGITSYGRIQDRDLELVGKFGQTIQDVYLIDCEKLTGVGLNHLRTLVNLKELIIERLHNVQNSDLALLIDLRCLRGLYLGFNDWLSDEALPYLSSLSMLEELELNGSEVSNEGLIHLKSLHSLKRISLRATKVTTEAAESLQKSLPNLIELRI